MYENWLANAVVISATLAAVSICVLAHYGGLIFVSRVLRGCARATSARGSTR